MTYCWYLNWYIVSIEVSKRDQERDRGVKLTDYLAVREEQRHRSRHCREGWQQERTRHTWHVLCTVYTSLTLSPHPPVYWGRLTDWDSPGPCCCRAGQAGKSGSLWSTALSEHCTVFGVSIVPYLMSCTDWGRVKYPVELKIGSLQAWEGDNWPGRDPCVNIQNTEN